jgi:predicted amidohydrolase/ribosomal protein S18 acetylase RimI-like enzyme
LSTEIESHARLVVRPLRPSDHPGVQSLHERCFPGISPWTAAQLTAQIAAFPEGQIGVELDGELVATSTSLIIDEDDYPERHTFADICGTGRLEHHDPEGDTLYGLDIAVSPEHRGMRLARRIYEERKALARQLNLARMVVGGRMPNYGACSAEMTPVEYVRRVLTKELRDPVITAQVANGFTVKGVLPDYLPSDAESCGNALLLEWHNPEFRPEGPERKTSIRVAAVQYQMRPIASFEDFARQVEFFVDTASEYRADFVLFPELLTNQLLSLVPAARPELAARRLHEFTGEYVRLFGTLAMRHNVNILAGTHLVVEDETLYNVAYVFHRDGRIDKRYKIHITPSEQRWWGVSPGSEVTAVDTDCGRIGIAICYDVEFPEMIRILREQGAQLLFVPYNTDLRAGHIRVRSCAQARCIENHMYVVTSGACGNLPMVEGADIHYAQSAILTPSDIAFARDGIAAEATPNVETMLVHDVDMGLLRRSERTGSVRPWIDRRQDVYRVVYTTPNE